MRKKKKKKTNARCYCSLHAFLGTNLLGFRSYPPPPLEPHLHNLKTTRNYATLTMDKLQQSRKSRKQQWLPGSSYRPVLVCWSSHDLENARHLVHVADTRKKRSAAHQLGEDAANLDTKKKGQTTACEALDTIPRPR